MDELRFGEACPQHPDAVIASVVRERVEAAGRVHWLVTATYACGHRHTQHAARPVNRVSDTGGGSHPVADAE